MKIDNFFAELKRRNVYKVAVAYAVVRVAAHSGGVDFVADVRSAAVGDEGVGRRHHLRFSGGADFFLGVRDYAGRNQTRIRDRAEQIDRAAHRAKNCCGNDRAGGRRGWSCSCISTRALEIRYAIEQERRHGNGDPEQIDRGAAVRQSEPRSGQRLLRRRRAG